MIASNIASMGMDARAQQILACADPINDRRMLRVASTLAAIVRAELQINDI
jgi:hypothetical protein